MILADSSIWIDHFRKPIDRLHGLIADGALAVHELVIAELALGSVPHRQRLIAYLHSFPFILPPAGALLEFVEKHALQGTGIGYVDAALLHACAAHNHSLWTSDKKLRLQSERIGLAFD